FFALGLLLQVLELQEHHSQVPLDHSLLNVQLFARLLDVRRPLTRAVQLQRVDVETLRTAHVRVDAQGGRVRVLEQAPQAPAAITQHQLQFIAVRRKLLTCTLRTNALRSARLFSGRRRYFSPYRRSLA